MRVNGGGEKRVERYGLWLILVEAFMEQIFSSYSNSNI